MIMKILIEETVIETKDIADIVDIEKDKKYFLNREAGFKVIMLDGSINRFGENIPYETTPNGISNIKVKWSILMEKVIKQWQSDKTELLSFKLND